MRPPTRVTLCPRALLRISQHRTLRFAFRTPTGGDVDLKSCDGTLFRVHSVLLGIASTVFTDMFEGATKSDTIELAEDAESVSLMLAFIYPVAPPQINTVDLLEKFMAMAHKYNVDKMIKFDDQIIQLQNAVIVSDPLRVFRASAHHHFPAVQARAGRSLRSPHCDLTSVEGVLKLSKFFPNSSHVIGLVGAQAVRAGVLAEVLLENHGSTAFIQSARDSPRPGKPTAPIAAIWYALIVGRRTTRTGLSANITLRDGFPFGPSAFSTYF